jgi:hypothetical protein
VFEKMEIWRVVRKRGDRVGRATQYQIQLTAENEGETGSVVSCSSWFEWDGGGQLEVMLGKAEVPWGPPV